MREPLWQPRWWTPDDATDCLRPCQDVTWSVQWSLTPDDFDIRNQATGTPGDLTFKETPNYEMPADSNGDNVYMVTVVATDAGVDSNNKMTAERAVVVTVTNVDEAGTVTLSSEQPKIGIPLTATLDDPDGVVADSVKWTWHAEQQRHWVTTPSTMATSDTYTPDGDRCPVGEGVSYTDGEGAGKNAVGTEMAGNVIANNRKHRLRSSLRRRPVQECVAEGYGGGRGHRGPRGSHGHQ